MKKIYVYDVDEDRIDAICNEFGVNTADVINALFEMMNSQDKDIGFYI